jgi:hypothetical protein
MAAFPSGAPANGTLQKARDDLRIEIAALNRIVAQASAWVEALEKDRVAKVGSDSNDWFTTDAAFDSANLATAQSLLTQLRAETSTTSTSGLNLRVKNTLSIK